MNRRVRYLVLVVGAGFTLTHASEAPKAASAPLEQRVIHNTTNQPLFVAVYNIIQNSPTRGNIRRIGDFETSRTIKVEPGENVVLYLPKKEVHAGMFSNSWYPQHLYASFTENILASTLDAKILDEVRKKSGSFASMPITRDDTDYYATSENDELELTASADEAPENSSFAAMVGSLGKTALDLLLASIKQQYEQHPYANQQAHVSLDAHLHADEAQFLHDRFTQIKKPLETIVSEQLKNNEVPRIAFSCTGGGCRAMIGALGAWAGADAWTVDSKTASLLGASVCIAGVSGSTWALAAFMHSGMPAKEILAKLAKTLNTPLVQLDAPAQIDIAGALLEQFIFEQPLSIINVYGALLAQKILSPFIKNPRDLTLVEQQSALDNRMLPLPIYTAIVDSKHQTQESHEQYGYRVCEFTPYATRLLDIVHAQRTRTCLSRPFAYPTIPTWAFGRKFNAGVSLDHTPPPSTGYIMGICGSAISVNIDEAYKIVRPQIERGLTAYLKSIGTDATTASLVSAVAVHGILAQYDAAIKQSLAVRGTITQERAYPAQVPNWTAGIKHLEFEKDPFVTLVDAGIDCNFPMSSLLQPEREINVIVMLDLGSNCKQLKNVERYARAHNLKFPKIPADYEQILAKQHCVVFQDNDPTIPTIIYVQTLKANAGYKNGRDLMQEKFTATPNFVYTTEQVQLLSGLAEYNMRAAQPIITKAIQQWVAMHRKHMIAGGAGETKRSAESKGDTKSSAESKAAGAGARA